MQLHFQEDLTAISTRSSDLVYRHDDPQFHVEKENIQKQRDEGKMKEA